MIRHALTFDVENWYDGNLHRDGYRGERDTRVVAETETVLELLAEHKTWATFFVLGRVADRHPDLVRSIAAAGHEVACHSQEHELVWRMTPTRFLDDLRRSRSLLQDLSGQPVYGFRAPSWSLRPDTLAWAPALIAQAGFRYDSSVFPMRTPYYGVPGAPTTPWAFPLSGGAQLIELPPAVARMGPARLPYAGGIYWRLLPTWAVRLLLWSAKDPVMLYLHPWELHPVPVRGRQGISGSARWVLTVGVGRAMESLRSLFRGFHFGPVADVYATALLGGVPVWDCSIASDGAKPAS